MKTLFMTVHAKDRQFVYRASIAHFLLKIEYANMDTVVTGSLAKQSSDGYDHWWFQDSKAIQTGSEDL
jgi:hypothetical protein